MNCRLRVHLDLVDEVKLDAEAWQLVCGAVLLLYIREARLVRRVTLHFYVTVVSEAPLHGYGYDASVDGLTYAVSLGFAWRERWPTQVARHRIDSIELVICVSRTPPGRTRLLLHASEIATIGRVCKWGVETVEMPIQVTVVAWDDVASTKRRLAATVAENGFTFGVSRLSIVRRMFIVVADAASLAIRGQRTRTGWVAS